MALFHTPCYARVLNSPQYRGVTNDRKDINLPFSDVNFTCVDVVTTENVKLVIVEDVSSLRHHGLRGFRSFSISIKHVNVHNKYVINTLSVKQYTNLIL
jgi:hypothetical protein